MNRESVSLRDAEVLLPVLCNKDNTEVFLHFIKDLVNLKEDEEVTKVDVFAENNVALVKTNKRLLEIVLDFPTKESLVNFNPMVTLGECVKKFNTLGVQASAQIVYIGFLNFTATSRNSGPLIRSRIGTGSLKGSLIVFFEFPKLNSAASSENLEFWLNLFRAESVAKLHEVQVDSSQVSIFNKVLVSCDALFEEPKSIIIEDMEVNVSVEDSESDKAPEEQSTNEPVEDSKGDQEDNQTFLTFREFKRLNDAVCLLTKELLESNKPRVLENNKSVEQQEDTLRDEVEKLRSDNAAYETLLNEIYETTGKILTEIKDLNRARLEIAIIQDDIKKFRDKK